MIEEVSQPSFKLKENLVDINNDIEFKINYTICETQSLDMIRLKVFF